MKEHYSTLVFSPHIDDEVLGCFSFLDANTFVLFAGVESRKSIPRQMRIAELNASVSLLSFAYDIMDNTVNQYVCEQLITPFEQAIARYRPLTVVIPRRSYNQDHRAVYDAALVATRPHDTNWRVNRVLAFEQPHSEIWPYETLAKPAMHRILDIDQKLDAYACYTSQIRGHRSPETVRALAALRGAEIGEPYAEAFHVLRWIDH